VIKLRVTGVSFITVTLTSLWRHW